MLIHNDMLHCVEDEQENISTLKEGGKSDPLPLPTYVPIARK